MSDMQWRKAGGETGHYNGPLFNLGHGIPRQLPEHGPRRAIFDLAFGYVSGFPVRDIIPFSIRSLFPQQPQPAQMQEVAEDEAFQVGTVWVGCPACGENMPATVSAEIVEDEDGRPQLQCQPDMTDLWAHMWTHRDEC